MLQVVLYSNQSEPGLEEAFQEAAAWVEQQSSRRCPWSLMRRPALIFGDDPYKAVVVDMVDVHRDPPGRYVALVRGAGGYAGGTTPREGYGVGVLGDWCLDGMMGRPWTPDVHDWVRSAGRNGQIGSLLHEWLHGYGLAHEDGGIMATPHAWPNVWLPACAALLADLGPRVDAGVPWWRRALPWMRQ